MGRGLNVCGMCFEKLFKLKYVFLSVYLLNISMLLFYYIKSYFSNGVCYGWILVDKQ